MAIHEAQLAGIHLCYETWGEQRAAIGTALLIHGLTSNRMAWGVLAPALAAENVFVVAPDLRGRGHSEKPPYGYSIPQHGADLLGLLDLLGVGRVTLVGHSLGAEIALHLAAMHPDRTQRLVLIDAGGPFPEDTWQAIQASVSRLGAVYPSLDAYLERMRQSPLHPWSDLWDAYYRYDAETRDDGTVTSRVPRAAIDEEVRNVEIGSRLDEWPRHVHAPTLIVRASIGMLGPDRGLVLPAAEAAWLQTTIHGSRLLAAEGTNHYTVLMSDDVAREIVRFVCE